MHDAENNMSLRQRKAVSKGIASEYRSWKRKLHREPTEDERRQITAIGFSKARRRIPSIPEPNPEFIDRVAGLQDNPTLPAAAAGAVVGSIVANALGNPGEYRANHHLEGAACSQCGGPLLLLGQLGEMEHYQCRNCGATVGVRASAAEERKGLYREYRYGENPLIRGDRLPYSLQRQVLSAYVYRWTTGNMQRGEAYGMCPHCGVYGGDPGGGVACRQVHPTTPLISDEQWLREHAFHVTNRGQLSLKQRHAEPGSVAQGNPLLMTVMGANPGAPERHRPEPNPPRRGRKVTMSLSEFARKVKSMNDPALWNNFLAKIRGYQKWSHGTLPSKVTVEAVNTPGVDGLMIMYDAGRAPEAMYIMPGGTKRSGAWKHPWDTMPEIKHDPEAGLVIQKLRGKSKITDFYHA